MLKTHSSKDLVMRALEMLAESIYPTPPDNIRLSPAAAASLHLLPLQQRDVIRLSASPNKSRALMLANMVCRTTCDQKVRTLLITSAPLPVLLVNLLLYRAKIDLDKIANPTWYRSEMGRLSLAAGEIARAPLFVASQTSNVAIMDDVPRVMKRDRTNCLVVDNPAQGSFWQWQQLSREFGVPITIISSTSLV